MKFRLNVSTFLQLLVGALLTFSYFLLQGKSLSFARFGMSLASCLFPKHSEDLMQKIISPVTVNVRV